MLDNDNTLGDSGLGSSFFGLTMKLNLESNWNSKHWWDERKEFRIPKLATRKKDFII